MDTSGVALIVGAGSGIGVETALTFAERGARGVIFADKNLAAAKEAAEQSRATATASGYEALAVYVDVTSRPTIKAMVAEAVTKFGRIDYAVNSAGLPRAKEATLSEVEDEEFQLLHEVNCRGILYCLQEEIEVMKLQEEHFITGRRGRRSIGRGSIVVITSLAAAVEAPKMTTYTASKFAARGVVKVAALENLKTGVRINEICPGYTNTPLLQRVTDVAENLKTLIERAMPLGRAAEPEEIAEVALFLASPSANFVHGEAIVVDSGVSVGVRT